MLKQAQKMVKIFDFLGCKPKKIVFFTENCFCIVRVLRKKIKSIIERKRVDKKK